MSSSPVVINDHSYHETSPFYSSLNISQEEHNKSSRTQCTYIPDNKTDLISWSQQQMNDLVLQLTNENEVLHAKINMLTNKFGHFTNHDNEQSDKNSSVTT